MSEDQTQPLGDEPRRQPEDADQDLTAKLRKQEEREIEQRRGERGGTNAPDREDPTTADAGASEAKE